MRRTPSPTRTRRRTPSPTRTRTTRRRKTRSDAPRYRRALGLLGLARRAGALTLGVDATRRGLTEGSVRLVVVAADASRTQLRKLDGPRERASVPLLVGPDRDALGVALGEASVSAIGVTSKSFATQLSHELASGEPGSPDTEGTRRAQEERRSDAGR